LKKRERGRKQQKQPGGKKTVGKLESERTRTGKGEISLGTNKTGSNGRETPVKEDEVYARPRRIPHRDALPRHPDRKKGEKAVAKKMLGLNGREPRPLSREIQCQSKRNNCTMGKKNKKWGQKS